MSEVQKYRKKLVVIEAVQAMVLCFALVGCAARSQLVRPIFMTHAPTDEEIRDHCGEHGYKLESSGRGYTLSCYRKIMKPFNFEKWCKKQKARGEGCVLTGELEGK
jgi:hypothetical protein